MHATLPDSGSVSYLILSHFSQLRKRDNSQGTEMCRAERETVGNPRPLNAKGLDFSWSLELGTNYFFICQMGIRKYPLA